MADEHSEDSATLEAVTEWDGGSSWIAHPAEDAERASHALVTESGVWLVDPVDADGLDAHLDSLGEVAGVAVVHDRHTRDAEAIAARHDVAVHVPDWMTLTREKLDADPEPLDDELPGTNYAIHRIIDTDEWEEAILVDDAGHTLVVMEALGTLPSFCDDEADVGVHPALDAAPEGLDDWHPERVLVGHGESVHDDATATLHAGLDAAATE